MVTVCTPTSRGPSCGPWRQVATWPPGNSGGAPADAALVGVAGLSRRPPPGAGPQLQVTGQLPGLHVVSEAGVMIATHGMHDAAMPIGTPEGRVEIDGVGQIGKGL